MLDSSRSTGAVGRFKAAAKLQGRQRPAQPVGGQYGGRRHAVDAYLTGDDADVLRRDRAHTFEQRNARRQVAALRSERGSRGRKRHQHDAVHGQRTWQRGGARVERVNAIPADRHAVGRVVGQTRQRRHRKPPRPAQRSRWRPVSPARCERAGVSEDAAQPLGALGVVVGAVMAAPSRPAGGMPLGGVFGQRKASRKTVAQRAPVRRRHVDGSDAQRLDAVDALQHGAHVGIAFGV